MAIGFLLLVPFFLLLLGTPLVLGLVALVRINRSEGRLRGRGLALAAVILSSIMLAGVPIVLLGFRVSATATTGARVRLPVATPAVAPSVPKPVSSPAPEVSPDVDDVEHTDGAEDPPEKP